MKLKLDENLDVRLASFLTAKGFEADTVLAEGLSGRNDESIYEACRTYRRVLITLDLDFSNPFRFPPEDTEGIVVIRLPRPILPMIQVTLLSVLSQFETHLLKGKLWIVEPGRIRVYDPHEESQTP